MIVICISYDDDRFCYCTCDVNEIMYVNTLLLKNIDLRQPEIFSLKVRITFNF